MLNLRNIAQVERRAEIMLHENIVVASQARLAHLISDFGNEP
jgi:hypothetical protein